MTKAGPGFRRMMERLGPEKAEALRQDTLRRQREALEAVHQPTKPRANKSRDRAPPKKELP